MTKRLTEKFDNETLHYDMKNECGVNNLFEYIVNATNKLGQLEDIEEGLGIDLINLLNAKSIYIATFLYWRWNLRDKQQCKKDDIGAIEEKRIEEESNFCIDLINKEIVIIESKLVDDFDYETKITKLKFKDYGIEWALTKEELEE